MKKDFVHAARDLGPVISQNIDEEENNRRLSQPVVNALKSAGFYKMPLPDSLGGFENDPLSTAKAVHLCRNILLLPWVLINHRINISMAHFSAFLLSGNWVLRKHRYNRAVLTCISHYPPPGKTRSMVKCILWKKKPGYC